MVALVAGEAAAWTAVGAIVGLVLGLAIAVVLVHVVNPQSFQWTMELRAPHARIAAVLAMALAAGIATDVLSAHANAQRAGAREMVARGQGGLVIGQAGYFRLPASSNTGR